MRNRIALVAACSVVLAIARKFSCQHCVPEQDTSACTGRRNYVECSIVDRARHVRRTPRCDVYLLPHAEGRGRPARRAAALAGRADAHGSPFPRVQWAFQAPKIAGLPGGWTEDDLVRFLQTGVTPTGRTAQPPMPPFRMNEEEREQWPRICGRCDPSPFGCDPAHGKTVCRVPARPKPCPLPEGGGYMRLRTTSSRTSVMLSIAQRMPSRPRPLSFVPP